MSRRDFLRGAGLAGAGAVLLGACGSDENKGTPTGTPETAIDPAAETTAIRLSKNTLNPRWAPLYLAEQFLSGEGFTDVQYIDVPPGSGTTGGGFQQIAAGEVDITLHLASSVTVAADTNEEFVLLAGVHNSVFELFVNDRVQSLRDLEGKRIWTMRRDDPTDAIYSQMAALLAYVGIDVEQGVEWVEASLEEVFQKIQAGEIDAWLSTRPNSTIQRELGVGHVLLDGPGDPPWSQYFGAMLTGNRDIVEAHPAATKRALRAILRATDLCARQPERAAHYLVDRGLTPFPYDQALDAITGVSYAAWREFNPEDTLRFYALRLKEAGLVTSTPDELISRATDWSYLEEIKLELAV